MKEVAMPQSEKTLSPISNTGCHICRSSSSESVLPQASDYITGHVFSVIRCKECGTQATEPQPSNLDPYYPSLYRRYKPLILNILNFFYRRKAKNWSRLFAQPGKALEIGCGDGLMLKALKDVGWVVDGIERTEAMCQEAEALLQQKVYSCDLNELPDQKKYDLIILFQVLEHIGDPLPLLKQCASRLSPGGRLLVAVPNRGSWQARMFGSDWFHLDVPRHLFHYTPESLRSIFFRVGLEVEGISYSSFEHDPYGWVQSCLNYFGKKHNRLTRILMRMDSPTISDVPTFLVAAVMAPLAFALALISWQFGQGAIMRASAIKRK
jgi:SAM-dependent methyltransferase